MTSDFKYASTIYGHNADVRSIVASPLPGTHIISGSRDKTARLWVEDSDGSGYHQGQIFEGQTNFTSSVAGVAPSDNYPEGLVFTGSNDKIIRIFSPLISQPIAELKGHTDTVCTLATGQSQMLVSGSWDKTARVWIFKKNADGAVEGKQVLLLEGHSAAVWAVLMLQQGLMATGSADKTIKLWKAGKCVHTFKGHEDCVRDLAIVSACQFLSCSNDATIRKWTTTGECIQVYYGHTNYTYSISVMADSRGFVTSGEDKTLKIWSFDRSDATQTLALPAQSGWNIAVLQNGDVAVALSDSTIRIFTENSNRAASDADALAYESEVSESLKKQDNNEEIDEKNVQHISALEIPGAKDGQVIMVRNETVIEAHQWNETDMKWTKIGDVVSSSDKKSAKRKTAYEGQEYDFVFDVDIQEGAPPLKLPYNLSDDPWFAAQKFIDDNDLSQYFLEEICTFIMDNTKEARKNYVPEAHASSNSTDDPFTGSNRYVPNISDGNTSSEGREQDPFTGGGRYVPGSDNLSAVASGEDPFTGGRRYVPGSGDHEIHFGGGATADPLMNPNRYVPDDNEQMDTSTPAKGPVSSAKSAAAIYFPKEGYITFGAANVDAILGKLTTFSAECGGLSESEMKNLKALLQSSRTEEPSGLDTLWKVLQWQPEYLLPALDILRLTCLLNETCCKQLCSGTSESDEKPRKLLGMLCNHITATENLKSFNANRLLSLRAICNMFKHPDGSAFVMASYKDIFQALSSGFGLGLNKEDAVKSPPFFGNKNVQIAAASVLLNYSVLLMNSQSIKLSPLTDELSTAVRSSCVEVTIVHLVTGENLSDPEATFRYLVCLGTLISNENNGTWIKEARALGAEKVVETAGAMYSNIPKIFECTKCLSAVLFE